MSDAADRKAIQDACPHPRDRWTPYGVCRDCGFWSGAFAGRGDPNWRRYYEWRKSIVTVDG